MGAHLHYKIEPAADAPAVNEWLAGQPEQERLKSNPLNQYPHFHEEDTEWAEDRGDGFPIKTSSLRENRDGYLEDLATLFAKLHAETEFEIKVLTSSCSLRLQTFSPEQLWKLTNGGNALSGEGKFRYQRVIEKVNAERHHIEPLGEPVHAMVLDCAFNPHYESLRPDDIECRTKFTTEEIIAGLEYLSDYGLLRQAERGDFKKDKETEPEAFRALWRLYSDIPTTLIENNSNQDLSGYHEPRLALFAESDALMNALSTMLTVETESLRVDQFPGIDPGTAQRGVDQLIESGIIRESYDTFYSLADTKTTHHLIEHFNNTHPALAEQPTKSKV